MAVAMFQLPLEGGLLLAATGAIVAWPLVFDLAPAKAFADITHASYDELPDPVVWVNTGTWTWAWMEPLIGTASFSILCLQLFRGQMKKLALKPYTHYVQSRRANRLADRYPQYTRSIVKDFGRSQPLRGLKYNPVGKTW